MRFSFLSALVVALAADATVASSWFGKPVYNKWHETELERWLSDHDIPYPTPADRKDLEKLVKENWNNRVGTPYASWDAPQLQSYLSSKGHEVKKGTEKNKDSLVNQVKQYWYESEDQASDAYNSVKDWIFDTWSDSQLKAFLDRHGIPNPQPRNRDTLLKAARENYQSAAEKAGETAAYPGNWLYETWSESDLKRWLDEHNIPAPQGSNRNKLVAAVRRNARYARDSVSAKASAATASVKSGASAASASVASGASGASASASSATQSISDAIFDTWSDSQIKEWADRNGIKVPQGSKRNELLALARKHKAKLSPENMASSASSAGTAATDSAKSAASGASASVDSAASDASASGHSAASGASSYVSGASASASSKLSSAASQAGDYVGAATSSAGNEYARATDDAALKKEQAKGAVGSYIDWIKQKLGLAASSASSAGASATNAAAASASSGSAAAKASASSASAAAAASASSASKHGKGAPSSASKSGQKAKDAATESATQIKDRIKEAAQKATDYVKEEL